MSVTKKYYWLKLNIDFFDREEIKLIENSPNGKDYIIFYMKLLLKSTNTDGRLMFKDVIPYTDEMLATITNTNIDVVRSAVKMFIQLGMMDKLDDGALFMIETQNMIGSETEYAKKQREYREKKKQELIEDKREDNIETKKDIVRQEKEIELDKEIDINNTHTEKIEKVENLNNDPVIIQQVLKKYKELGLPEYEYRPDNYVILEVYNNLGANKLLEALKIMSESEFVKNNLSINTIFKLDNLKKALNGNFKEKKKTKDKPKEFKKTEYKDFTGDIIDEILGIEGG
ncbi:phage replisome organizer N-terminal domain-containing protein [Fusobacterium ulcerans]|uniref:phage replisome organizer N-terminal domain-containing protein n=1 Tax=Fusobacterium ulcerans TaxID=861 RepID=UPI0010312524|nr:phage replisome organizer N-terminal domain-containing protein [Fusobacterium ulcerans]